ncbi:MAG: DNA adenine methylase [Firmicutes bacterium]|nr:DNA adenine methylase [Bacillota bacterium]
MGVARPFLKWAGGKGQLLDKFRVMYPADFKVYIEPFVGGGAVLFDVMQRFNIEKAVIIDINTELINCYQCIKKDVAEVIRRLEQLEKEFNSLVQSEFYYMIRNRYNKNKINVEYDFEKAADFIFLNKTCFNGLYRVNSKGEFNVPFGKYKNPNICDRDNLLLVSKLLQRVEIIHGDYKQCREFIVNNAFVYFDPPYRPLTLSASFVSYSHYKFSDDEQKKLAALFYELNERGCRVMLSNSDPKNADPNDNFFDEIYKGFDIQRINAKRMINCQADKRGEVTEIIVRNYKK